MSQGQGWRDRRVNTYRWRKLRALILVRDQGRCLMVDGCPTPATTVDHVVPLILGGSMFDPSNLRAACARHNQQAGQALSVPSARRDLGAPSREWVIR